jgi:hypothetical protein
MVRSLLAVAADVFVVDPLLIESASAMRRALNLPEELSCTLPPLPAAPVRAHGAKRS